MTLYGDGNENDSDTVHRMCICYSTPDSLPNTPPLNYVV